MRRLLLAIPVLALAAGAAFAQPKDTLVVDMPGDVATMDPHLQWDTESYTVYRNIFDNLVTRDDDGKIAPQIATAWSFLSDTEVEFDIRQGVVFHDGSPLTAGDVAFSIQRIIDPALRSPQLSNFNRIVARIAPADWAKLAAVP